MSTKNFSRNFYLTEHEGKYGLSDKNGRVILHPVCDSVWELDSLDFIIEQDGKLGYASFNAIGETELLLAGYDVIIKKEHGLALENRGETDGYGAVSGEQYLWYDTKSYSVHRNIRHVRTFREYDLFVSTKKCDYKKPPFLKKWGESSYLEFPLGISADVLCEIPYGKISFFVVVESDENDEYKYSFLIVKEDGEYTFTAPKTDIEKLYKTLPDLTEDLKCDPNTLKTTWLSPKQK